MDSEKYIALEKKLRTGISPNDEGPFYHHAWWESYKGSIKGKLGGVVIGALMGAVVGGAVAGVMALGGISGIALTFAALTGAGMLYGLHEFNDIGKIVGAQAAGLEEADVREAIRFAELEQKIDRLTDLVSDKTSGGKSKSAATAPLPTEKVDLEDYRTTHYARLNGSTQGPVFWKVTLMGLLVGAAAGAMLALGGETSTAWHVFKTLGIHLQAAHILPVSMATFGAFGASFGINRDVFRRLFDVTDLWTKGIISHGRIREEQIEAGKEIEEDLGLKAKKEQAGKEAPAPVATAVFAESPIDYPASSTYHRDRVLAAAEKALINFDHTRATPQ